MSGPLFSGGKANTLTPEHGFAVRFPPQDATIPNVKETLPRLLELVERPSLHTLRESRRLVLGKILDEDPEDDEARCIVDELTTRSMISESLANALPPSWHSRCKAPIDREHFDIRFFSPDPDRAPRLLPHSLVVVFTINSQSYYHEFLVVKELFPDAPELGIEMILGLDFLQAQCHLVLRPVFREWILDMVPWENNTGRGEEPKSNFVIDDTGRLTIYVYGHTHHPQSGEAKRSIGLFFGPNSLFNQAFEVPVGSAVGNTEYDLSCFAALVAVRQLVNLAPYFKIADSFWSLLIITTSSDLVLEAKSPSPRENMISVYHERSFLTSLCGYRENIPITFAHRTTEERPAMKAAKLLAMACLDLRALCRTFDPMAKSERRLWKGSVAIYNPLTYRYIKRSEEGYLKARETLASTSIETPERESVEDVFSLFLPDESWLEFEALERILEEERVVQLTLQELLTASPKEFIREMSEIMRRNSSGSVWANTYIEELEEECT